MRFFSAILLTATFFIASSAKSQNLADAKTYFGLINKQCSKVSADMLSYSSDVAKNKKADKLTASGKKILTEINKSELAIGAMPAFQKNKDLKDSAALFMKNCFDLLNVDYGKIATNRSAAEKSYDKMKDLLAAKVTADQKLKAIMVSYHAAAIKFSTKVTVPKDEYSDKVDQAIAVNIYYNKIYLLFFKTYSAESYLLDAIKKKDSNSVAQNKKIVYQDAQNGLKQLDSTKDFNDDNSLVTKCQAILTFYSDESDEKLQGVVDYFAAAKDFQKQRSNYERKPTHTKAEVKEYKAAVNDYNKALKKFTKTADGLNKKREKAWDHWNKAAKDFLSKHLPKK